MSDEELSPASEPRHTPWNKGKLTGETRQAVDEYLRVTGKKPGEFLLTGRRSSKPSMTTRQYARLVSEWIASIGLDPRVFGTHSLRRTEATVISRRTGNPTGCPAPSWS